MYTLFRPLDDSNDDESYATADRGPQDRIQTSKFQFEARDFSPLGNYSLTTTTTGNCVHVYAECFVVELCYRGNRCCTALSSVKAKLPIVLKSSLILLFYAASHLDTD